MSERLISPAEIRDAARQVSADQTTWRDGNAAVNKMVAILTEPTPPSTPELQKLVEDAFALGFMISREGFNAECTHDHCCDGLKPDHQTEEEFHAFMAESKDFIEARTEAVARLLPLKTEH